MPVPLALGFPKTNYDSMCAICTEGTCSPTQDCLTRLYWLYLLELSILILLIHSSLISRLFHNLSVCLSGAFPLVSASFYSIFSFFLPFCRPCSPSAVLDI